MPRRKRPVPPVDVRRWWTAEGSELLRLRGELRRVAPAHPALPQPPMFKRVLYPPGSMRQLRLFD